MGDQVMKVPLPGMQSLNSWSLKPWVKPLIWLVCALPAMVLLGQGLSDQLGPDPVAHVTLSTGLWALRWLWITLAVTPLRHWLGWPALLRWRRAFGVSAFVYASLHLCTYVWLDKAWVLADIWHDLGKRPFILVGMLTWLVLLPLAMSSTNAAIRAMGGRRWQALHRLVYAAALMALLHFYWKKAAKHDLQSVQIYAALLGAMLGWRLMRAGGWSGLLRSRSA